MKTRWMPAAVVLVVVIAIISWKLRSGTTGASQPERSQPQVLLVATPAEAVSPTRCGDIVRLVRSAGQRGVAVQELTPDSDSQLLARYRVLRTPTVLILEPQGTVRSRYEGETPETLAALQSEIQQMVR